MKTYAEIKNEVPNQYLVINPGTVKCYNGKSDKHYNVFIKISYKKKDNKNDMCLSISGVVGPWASGNCAGSCGQIIDELLHLVPKGDWKSSMVLRLHEYWERWHLNNLKAGTPEQEDAIRLWTKSNKYDYTTACEYLKSINLYEVDGYKYGHSWLTEKVPKEVIDYLFALPETKTEPAWV